MDKEKLKKEIDQLFRDILDEDKVSEDEFREMEKELLSHMGKDKQQLSDEIEIGVQNGYPVEQQMEIIRKLLNM